MPRLEWMFLNDKGEVATPTVLAQIDARTKATLRADLPGLAKELKIGGGSGIREVTGTVALTAADPALVEVYATAAATVQGEPLEAGAAALFRRFGGGWQVRVMGADGSVKDRLWRSVGTPIQPEPGGSPVPVTLNVEDVLFSDVEGSANDKFTLAAKTGVNWTVAINGAAAVTMAAGTHTVTPAGAKVVVVPVPATAAYVLTGQSSWSYTFDGTVPVTWTKTVLKDTFTRGDGRIANTQADTGQTWQGSVYDGNITGGAYALPLVNRHSFVPAASGDLSIRAKVMFPSPVTKPWATTLALRGNSTFDSGATDGFTVTLNEEGNSEGRAVLAPAPATMTFNQEGRKEAGGATSYWSKIAGWVPGTTHTLRMDLRGGVLTVYVDGNRILEGTLSAAQLAAASGSNVHVWGSGIEVKIDDLEVLAP